MDRIIDVKVFGNHLTKDGKNAGTKGEANINRLRITFDEGWEGFAKEIIFWDAYGENPVRIELTTNLLEDIVKSTRVYLVPIPAEPMARAGMMTFEIKGYLDNKKQASVSCELEVEESNVILEPIAPTPDQIQQMQAQYEEIIGGIREAAIAEQNAKNSEQNAKDSENSALNSLNMANQYANEAEEHADKALSAVGKASYIGDNGNWFAWDIENKVFYDTGVKAQAGSTVYYGDNPPADADVWIDPDGESEESKALKAVEYVVENIAEKAGTIPDTTNLWTLGDVEFTREKNVAFNLPAGSYTISMYVESNDTDDTAHTPMVCSFMIKDASSTLYSTYVYRDKLVTKTVNLTSDATKFNFLASTNYNNSAGDTAKFSQITIVDNNATKDVYTAKDDVARESNKDVEYVQNPNLYDGEWEPGRYVYETGKKYTGEASSHSRNVNPVPLDPNKGYNLAVNSSYATNDIVYVYRYDAEMNFLDKYISGKSNSVIHIEGASFVCFHIAEYGNRFPDEPLHVMVWECDDENQSYKEWLEYGEKGNYTKSNLLIEEENIVKAMLSRDKARFDDSFNYIAYSNVTNSGYWINSVEHFKWAAKQGFTALKGDVQPTSDGVLVMCHDSGFSLNDAGQVVSYNADTATLIHDMTSEQCLSLTYSGGTQHICSFDEFVKICKKYGKIAFITIRNDYMDEVVPALLSVLDKYNMRKRCIINSFNFKSLQAVRNVDNNITLHQVLLENERISISAINRAIELGNCMISGFSFPNGDRFDVLDSEAIAYAKANDIRLYQAMVNSMDDIDLLMEYGIAGAQMLIVPTLD